MSKPIKFYYDLLSQPARALYIFFKLTKIPFEGQPIAIRKGEHLTKEYAEINRYKKIPCIDDNGFKLAESVAIFRYLARENEIADHWYPKDSKKRALVDEYLEWQHINTRWNCSTYFWLKWVLPTMTGKVASAARLAEAKQNMEKTLDFINDVLLSDPTKQFIAGNEISIADLLAITELEQTTIAQYDPTEGRPNLKKYVSLVKQTIGSSYDEANSILYAAVKKNSAKL